MTLQPDKSAPVIGISSGGNSVSGSLVAIVTQIRSAGGVPKVLHNLNVKDHLNDTFSLIDGLVLMGNYDDVDPSCYGQQVHPSTNVETDTARREFEEAAIRLALEIKMPLLGICGGMQRINTLDYSVNGGTLIQHLPDELGHARHAQGNIPAYEPAHPIRIVAGTTLAEIAGYSRETPPPVAENSFHHQAVEKVHKELRPVAFADDDTIEAIEPHPRGIYAGQFVLGVQWHPEFGASELGPRLARRMVEEAKLFIRIQKLFPHLV